MRHLSLIILLVFSLLLSIATSLAQEPDLIIVGAGPVGLHLANQIKLWDPEIEIRVEEKYSKYTRDNTLKLDKLAFAQSHKNPQYQELISKWGAKEKILKIQGDLSDFAEKQGIVIAREREVKNPEDLLKEFPKVTTIVGADGAHSVVRHHFMTDEQTHSKDMEYVAQVKYLVKGETHELDFWKQGVWLTAKVNHPVLETVKRDADGQGNSQVILNIILGSKSYKKIGKINFKEPIELADQKLCEQKLGKKLYHSIHTWIEERGKILKEEKLDSPKVTSTNLPAYFAPQAYFVKGQATYFLVGDSAFGVPFFRSARNGFEAANYLAVLLAKKHTKHDPSRIGPKLFENPKLAGTSVSKTSSSSSSTSSLVGFAANSPEDYQRYMSTLQKREKLIAKWRSTGAHVLNMTTHFYQKFAHVPLGISELVKDVSRESKQFAKALVPNSTRTRSTSRSAGEEYSSRGTDMHSGGVKSMGGFVEELTEEQKEQMLQELLGDVFEAVASEEIPE